MKVKNAKQIITEISRILDDIEKLIPVEFNQKTRSLDDISCLKATECRLLLLCVLPVIFKAQTTRASISTCQADTLPS
jgi:hypothetical protein